MNPSLSKTPFRRRGRPPVTNWSNVDWSLSNDEVAASLGVAKSCVYYHRRQVLQGGKSEPINWYAVDWSQTNRQIANETGVSMQTVRAYRRAVCPGAEAPREYRKRDAWDTADWSLHDAELARQLGVSRQRVQQVRKQRGTPPAPRPKGQMNTRGRASRAAVEAIDREKLVALPAPLLAREAGLSAGIIISHRRALGVKSTYKEAVLTADRQNWDLSNKDLAEAWGLSIQVVTNGRRRLRTGRAKYDLRSGPHPERAALVAQEKAKAAEYFAANPYARYKIQGNRRPAARKTGRENLVLRYGNINWELPNRWLGKIWGLPFYSLADYRSKHGLRKPLWDGRVRNICGLQRAAVIAEQAKAKAFYDANPDAKTNPLRYVTRPAR